jgi:hypothetical protein
MLNNYVKEGYRPMHENVKDILLPLRLLRKGGYRLFSYEERINKNIDLNMFKDSNQLKVFINGIGEEFKSDEILQAKTNTPEELEKIMKRETKAIILKYSYNEEKLKEEKNDNQQNPYDSIALKTNKNTVKTAKKANEIAKKNYEMQQKALKEKEEKKLRLLIYPNIEKLTQPEMIKFERDALVGDFEKGFKAMLIYLNKKFPTQIPVIIDPHKFTVNLESIPKNRNETNFYLKQIEKAFYDLKKMCYEMKLNGLSRVLLPITANIEFTTQVKVLYDLHVLIDKLIGDKLKLEQYSFIYNEIDYIAKSNFHEELFYFKDKNFMEVGVSKYIFYQALCNSVKVMEKMRKNNRLNEIKYDNMDNYYQLTKLSLDSIDEFNSFNYYNFENYVAEVTNSYSIEIKKEISQNKMILNQELQKIGRFFILENFIDPDQKDNWIELTTQLIEINSAVREDIKDYLLNSTSKRILTSGDNDLPLSHHSSKSPSKKPSRNPSRSTSRKPTNMHKEGANVSNNNINTRKPKKLNSNTGNIIVNNSNKLNKAQGKKHEKKKRGK